MLERSAWHTLGTVVGKAFGWIDAKLAGMPITIPVRKVPMSELLSTTPLGLDADGNEVTLRAQSDDFATVADDGLVIATGLGTQATVFHAEDGYAFGQCIREHNGGGDLLSLSTLFNRRRWFMTFDLGTFSIGDYQVKDYLSVNGSYDGSWALTVLSSPIVEVCANTVAMAEAAGAKHYRFKHTSGIFNRVEEAKRALGTHRANRDAFQETGNKLLASQVSAKRYNDLINLLLPRDDDKMTTKARNVADAAVETITGLYKAEAGSRGLQVVSESNNGWAFVQAVNTYENWASPVRNTGGRSESETRALRQIEQLNSGKQVLTAKAIDLVLATN